jgi:endonuclease III
MNSKIAVKQLNKIKKIVSENPESPRLAAEGWNEKWQTLVSIMLSAQTRDTTTIRVCNNLFKKYKTPASLAKASLRQIERDIGSINYYKTKAKRIKETAGMIAERGKMGESVEELILFPGVGRKTANVYLVEVKKAAAIGVDTHLSYVSQYLNWSENKTPEKIEYDLMALFPKRYWNQLNWIVVSFGQIFRSRREKDELLNKISEIK